MYGLPKSDRQPKLLPHVDQIGVFDLVQLCQSFIGCAKLFRNLGKRVSRLYSICSTGGNRSIFYMFGRVNGNLINDRTVCGNSLSGRRIQEAAPTTLGAPGSVSALAPALTMARPWH